MSILTAESPRARFLPGGRSEWLTDPKTNLLAGLVVALALIPEAISFSIIAGVDPKVGLYASFSIAIIISFSGGRPGMISAATGAMALVIVPLVEEYGVGYLFAATVLAGVLQVGFGYLGVGDLMRFIPRTVMTGFVNALAILIFLAQVPHILLNGDDADSSEFGMNLAFIAIGLLIIYGLPRLTSIVPSPLVAIVLLAVGAIVFDLQLPTVGDMGDLPGSLPVPSLPDVPWNLDMFLVILPYSITLALVGLLESLLTAQLLDDLTDSDSDKNRESRGQGIANVATGFLGGMAGCAMIGQSMINHRTGGRTRLSTLASGVFLIVLILALGDFVAQIPMGALVAVMVMVSISTFNWHSVAPDTVRADAANRNDRDAGHRGHHRAHPQPRLRGRSRGGALGGVLRSSRLPRGQRHQRRRPGQRRASLRRERRAVLCLDQRSDPFVRLRRSEGQPGRDRPEPGTHLGHLRSGRTRCRRREVRRTRHQCRTRRAQRPLGTVAPQRHRPLRRRSLRLLPIARRRR